jgi:hypothetical protein
MDPSLPCVLRPDFRHTVKNLPKRPVLCSRCGTAQGSANWTVCKGCGQTVFGYECLNSKCFGVAVPFYIDDCAGDYWYKRERAVSKMADSPLLPIASETLREWRRSGEYDVVEAFMFLCCAVCKDLSYELVSKKKK